MVKVLIKAFMLLALITVAVCSTFYADAQSVQLKGPKNSTSQKRAAVYGPINSDDTLWQIASRYRQNRELTIYQAMYAIYQLNPEAFEQNNINLLKDGSMLSLPSEDFIAGVDKATAKARAESDAKLLEGQSTGNDGASKARGIAKSATNASADELNQTKQLIEEKLGALDEAQSRQFLAIRRQFAESISNAQAILDENQKLFERLDKVNSDIEGMRAQEASKAQQMDQMGQSIEKLLEKAQQDETLKQQALAESEESWIDSPWGILALSTIASLSLLGGFAYFLIKRNAVKNLSDLKDSDDGLELDDHNSALDDLSDALSDELAEELGDELDDDNLFGDDDLLDDVLADELSESLDEALDSNLDESLDADLDGFDDSAEEPFEPELQDDDFEAGAAQIDQSDLDSLFDEEDNLLAEMPEEQEDPSDVDVDNTSNSEGVGDEDSTQPDVEEDSEAAPISTITDNDEPPEISIDELFDAPVVEDDASQFVEADESEEINEEFLQQLDKDISAQNAELDNLTGNLLDELEQVEQMRDFLDESEALDDTPVIEQPSLKKLDEDSLAEGFDENEDLEANESAQDSDQKTEEIKDELANEADDNNDIDPDLVSAENDKGATDNEKPAPIESDSQILESVADEHDLEGIESARKSTEDAELLEQVTDEIEPKDGLNESEQAVDDSISQDNLEDTQTETDEELDGESAVADDERIMSSDLETESHDNNSEIDKQTPSSDDAVEPDIDEQSDSSDELDEDELLKAIEDFENEDVEQAVDVDEVDDVEEFAEDDAVSEELPSSKSSTTLDSLDDLEFGMVADNFVQGNSTDKVSAEEEEEADDSLLEQALDELDSEEQQFDIEDTDDELSDLPGLGDWLSESDTKQKSPKDSGPTKLSPHEDESLLDELENTNFDELLSAIDADNEQETGDSLDGLDLSALLSEEPRSEKSDDESGLTAKEQEDDFLDVEALLSDSFSEDEESPADRDLDLSSPLSSFFGDPTDSGVDVDDDSGFGAKLDLAHAYIEIGENESAIELLEDIVENGSELQRTEAKVILTNITS